MLAHHYGRGQRGVMTKHYPSTIPKVIPPGAALVHNHVHPARRQGTRGFRFWLQPGTDGIELCDCKWAPEVSQHYRSVKKS